MILYRGASSRDDLEGEFLEALPCRRVAELYANGHRWLRMRGSGLLVATYRVRRRDVIELNQAYMMPGHYKIRRAAPVSVEPAANIGILEGGGVVKAYCEACASDPAKEWPKMFYTTYHLTPLATGGADRRMLMVYCLCRDAPLEVTEGDAEVERVLLAMASAGKTQ